MRSFRFAVLAVVAGLAGAAPFPSQARAQDDPQLAIDSGGHLALVRGLAISLDGARVYTASDDKTVRVWNAVTGEPLQVFRGEIGPGYGGRLFAAALSPNGQTLAVGGWMPGPREGLGSIKLLDAQTGDVRAVWPGHTGAIFALAFSPDGRWLLSTSSDNTGRIWNVSTGQTQVVLNGHADYIYGAAFSPDGKLAATGSNDKTIRLWRVPGGEPAGVLTGHTLAVRSLAFSPDGRWLVSGSTDQTVRLWDAQRLVFVKVLANFPRGLNQILVTPDSRSIVVSATDQGTQPFEITVVGLPDGAVRARYQGNTSVVLGMGLTPDGDVVSAGGVNLPLHRWNLQTGQQRWALSGQGRLAWDVGFARDGRSIAWGHTFVQDSLTSRGTLEWAMDLDSLSAPYRVTNPGSYVQGVLDAGGYSVATPSGTSTDNTLEIRRGGAVVHRFVRDSTNGVFHRSLTLTPDGRTAISGGGNGGMGSYDTSSGQALEFSGHVGDVWGVATSPDGKLLVSGSDDQTVKLWSVATGKVLLTIFQTEDNDWVAWTPEGYYRASAKGDKYIGWHVNQGLAKAALYYPASTFAGRFNQPALVRHYIATVGQLQEALRLANAEQPAMQVRQTTGAELKQLLPPSVYFILPEDRSLTTAGSTVKVRVGARSVTQDPVDDLWITINGRALGDRGVAVKASGGADPAKRLDGLKASLEADVPLQPGENRIAVIAKTRNSQSEPELLVVTRQAGAQPEAFRPSLYVLAVGVSKYQNASLNLGSADADARSVADLFRGQQGRLFGKVTARVLVNQEATQDSVLDGLDWLLKQSTQRDVSVIFVAGHGVQDDGGSYYFLPHNANVSRLRSTAVRWSEFDDALKRLPSKALLLVDTCHSGGVTGQRRGVADFTEALRDLLRAETGTIVMAASTGQELSQERPEWGHGAFTMALLEGLGGKADVNHDGVIDIKELDLYVTNRVKELTGGAQHPTTEIPKIMPNIPVAAFR